MSSGTMSPDGLFYWDGVRWVSTLSADGAWRWTGIDWVPISGPSLAFHDARRYVSPRSLGLWVSVLLGTSIAMALISFVAKAYFNFSVAFGDQEIVYSIDLGGLVVFAITAAVFLVWFHRAYRNLPSLGAADLGSSPDWAVAWWFVPMAGWWLPYRAATEIWRASDPNAPATTSAQSRAGARAAALLVFWWAAWITSIVLVNVASLLIYSESMQVALFVASAAATLVAGVLAILVVLSIGERQDRRWNELAAAASAQAGLQLGRR